jgi:hypothetical protein
MKKSESISDLTLTKSAETITSTPRQKRGMQALRGGLSRWSVNLNKSVDQLRISISLQTPQETVGAG